MSDFRHKLRKEVVDPALQTSRKATLLAVIKKRLGKFNSYTIEFTNEDGEKETKSGVKVRTYNNESPTGFKENDTVLVEYENKKYEIIASYSSDEYELKSSTELKSDIYSNLISETLPGFIM